MKILNIRLRAEYLRKRILNIRRKRVIWGAEREKIRRRIIEIKKIIGGTK